MTCRSHHRLDDRWEGLTVVWHTFQFFTWSPWTLPHTAQMICTVGYIWRYNYADFLLWVVLRVVLCILTLKIMTYPGLFPSWFGSSLSSDWLDWPHHYCFSVSRFIVTILLLPNVFHTICCYWVNENTLRIIKVSSPTADLFVAGGGAWACYVWYP